MKAAFESPKELLSGQFLYTQNSISRVHVTCSALLNALYRNGYSNRVNTLMSLLEQS